MNPNFQHHNPNLQCHNMLLARGDITVIAPELHMYSRQRNLKKVDVHPPEYCKESEPIADPGINTGKSIPSSDLNVLVVIRKRIRSCTIHPISKYV